MKKIAPITLILLISALSTVDLTAFDTPSLDLYVRLSEMSEAASPDYIAGQVLFSYKPNRAVRSVAVTFNHEGYSRLHVFERNRQGIYVLLYPLPAGIKELKYRYVIDGLWIADPVNPSRETDAIGNELSLYHVPEQRITEIRNPVEVTGTTVRLRYMGIPGQRVTVQGDFNGFDPFTHVMKPERDNPGYYTILLSLTPGRHIYRLVIDGSPLPDPHNSTLMYDKEQRSWSVLTLR